MIRDYHKFIFDLDAGKVIGDFDGAYRECKDVWPSQHEVYLFKHDVVCQRALRAGRSCRVLDVGAGYGDFLARLCREGVNAVGVEVSPSAVAKGLAKHGDGLPLQVGDLRRGLDFPDGNFDLVVCYGVLGLLVDHLDFCLAELVRLLSPEGMLAVSISLPPNPRIGRDVVPHYASFVGRLRSHVQVLEVARTHDNAQLADGVSLDECVTDLVAFGRRLR